MTSSAYATPPNIRSKSTAQSELNALTVAAEGSMTSYSRDKSPHWITISGTCNTRETVLKRDGDNVLIGSDCDPDSGSWYSPYDNDLGYPQLIAVTDNVISSKGDKDPSAWKPQSNEKSALQSMINACSS
ncbi:MULTISPECIES: hypothetical protein [Streptomyces]|uniref:hypothetical protein n=1 Tax=Streptomyces TaxID=1883 RepID=UPI001488061B|nr:hypothetical protein [Streptomyces sp. Z423-1]